MGKVNQKSRYRPVGEHPSWIKAMELVEKVAPRNLRSIRITGPTGSGKEVVAKYVHRLSGRTGVLHSLNCAVIQGPLVQSELFGYEKGAFTGANSLYKGAFETSNNGALFLDEIAELSLDSQPLLLRALDSREFSRLGSTTKIKFDAQIITATHANLPEMVAKKTFREDLFHRLNGMPIAIPSLKEREMDVILLTRHFLDKHPSIASHFAPRISPEVQDWLLAQSWPGNVRELITVLERCVCFNDGPVLKVAGLEAASEVDGPPLNRGSLQDEEPKRNKPRLIGSQKPNVSSLVEEFEIFSPQSWVPYRIVAPLMGLSERTMRRVCAESNRAGNTDSYQPTTRREKLGGIGQTQWLIEIGSLSEAIRIGLEKVWNKG